MRMESFKLHMAENITFTDEERKYIISESVKINTELMTGVIIMEELAELQEALTNTFSCVEADPAYLLDEIADVWISIEYLKYMYGLINVSGPRAAYSLGYEHKLTRAEAMRINIKLLKLQQAVSKCLRKHDNCYRYLHVKVVEATTAMIRLKTAFNLSDADINKAIDVKLEREVIRKDLHVGGYY